MYFFDDFEKDYGDEIPDKYILSIDYIDDKIAEEDGYYIPR